MYWTSPLVGKAVALELVQPRLLERLARRVRRCAGDQPPSDLIWAEELVQAGLLSRYQAQTLLGMTHPVSSSGHETWAHESPLKVGAYTVFERVARSDLGVTYRGCRPIDKHTSAIKLVDRQWIRDDVDRARLLSEVERWRKLGDPRVVPATPLEVEADGLALISSWVGSGSLANWLRAGRRVAPAAAVWLVCELIKLLARADVHGLVHGDLRPSHVIVDGRGQIRLIDCGVRYAIRNVGLWVERNLPPARYDYVAPEVAAGKMAADPLSDIYAIGCLLYHLVTGRPPYFGGSAERKCALHRAGRLVDTGSLGLETGPDVQRILQATLQADRSRRVGSYNELLSQLSPGPMKLTRGIRAQVRRVPMLHCSIAGVGRFGSPAPESNHWGKWFVWATTAAATAVAVLHGSSRLLPLLSLRPTTWSQAIDPGDQRKTNKTSLPVQRRTVTDLWNATEDLRAAFREAGPHDTITLQSPGPFLLDAIEINKPITLRGAEGIRPLFLGGPESTFRITASAVRLENVHFIRVEERLGDQSGEPSSALLDIAGQSTVIAQCSFQDMSGRSATAIHWHATSDATGTPASLGVEHVLFRDLDSAIVLAGLGGAQIEIQNCLHLGRGPLIRSTSGPARPFETLELALSRVTVYGASTAEHKFPHPLDDAAPLRVIAREGLLIPSDRDQPLLAVQYAVQPTMLMPKVSWSGSNTLCPADATMLQVKHGSDALPWRASDVAAWHKYWGSHTTGLIGARLDFAGAPPFNLPDIRSPRRTDQLALGADMTQLCYPLPVALEQLPLLIERLGAR
jgi:serine/threonine-protein kinase